MVQPWCGLLLREPPGTEASTMTGCHVSRRPAPPGPGDHSLEISARRAGSPVGQPAESSSTPPRSCRGEKR
jgi:hypothetical protein